MQIQVQKWFLGFALLFLWSDVLTVSGFTEDQLRRVTDHIRNTITGNFAHQYSYAVKFSTPSQCSELTNENIQEALKHESANDFLLRLRASEIYNGRNLVAATFRDIGNKRQHAEARLLFPENQGGISPVQALLNSEPKAGCVLFYTLNSPCTGVCAKPGGEYNIIDQLDVFASYNNRAFVYNDVYHVDFNRPHDTVHNAWSAINKKVPLYRCFTGHCVKCFDKQNNLDNNCFYT
ncbi:uncharacterized protein LOC142492589 [Ascaphus truei]|uniref:uncharacterized protein LOC142492589 n=1 Tax=Ascaphus truei TaxID=8439 RepID=UPI003F5A8D4C